MYDSKKLILVKVFTCLIAKDYDVFTIITMLALTQLATCQTTIGYFYNDYN